MTDQTPAHRQVANPPVQAETTYTPLPEAPETPPAADKKKTPDIKE